MGLTNEWEGVVRIIRHPGCQIQVFSRCRSVNQIMNMDRAFKKVMGNSEEVYVKAHINPMGMLLVDGPATPSQW